MDGVVYSGSRPSGMSRPSTSKRGSNCCNVNLSPEQVECARKIKEKWMEKRNSSDKENVDMSDVGCTSDCIFTTDIVTSDNEIITEEVKPALDKILEGPEWQSLSPTMIETCKNRAVQGSGGRKGHAGHCNMVKEKFLFCINEQIIEHCPDSLWKNDEECNKARTYLKNCPYEKRFGGKRGQQEEQ
ncbi:uncharacterized protein LOC119066649 isoform X2 [Bradysia coprophila]|uniref:uncharacterized protein LOC119066649 isoform X2 n=1 Tax=Bradysia coprophila TaxID=38358 RepID=UPI00187D7049|nr:uncharacterized protein LOC119066649 isoform X2 [Bradysia coprophila]